MKKNPAPKVKLAHPLRVSCMAIFIFFLALYISTAPRVNVSYADSDLLTTIGYHLGVAHPPGYPLYITLVNIFTHLPIPGTIAFRAHLLSAVLHSATLTLLFASIYRIISSLPIKSEQLYLKRNQLNLLISFISVSLLGFSFLFWTYSSVAEKYALNDLFAALIFFLSVQIFLSPKPTRKQWFLLAFTFGLSLNHHHTIALLTPMLLYLAWLKRDNLKKHLSPSLIAGITAICLSILLLLWLNTHDAPVSWRFEASPNGLYRMLTRKDLAGYLITTGEYRGMYMYRLDPQEILNKLPVISDLFIQHFGVITLLLFGLGWYKSFAYDRKLAILVSLVVVFTTIFIPIYLKWPADLSNQSLRIRMFLLGHVFIPPFVALGLYSLLKLFQNKQLPRPVPLIVVVGLVYLSSRLFTIYPQVNLRSFDLVSNHYRSILESVPENTLFACIGDVSCFALLYSQRVEGIREDVIILPHAHTIVKKQIDSVPDLKGFDYASDPQLYMDYLTWNIGKRPVAIIDLQKAYHDWLGMEYGFSYYSPQGYYGLLSQEPMKEVPSVDYDFSYQLAQQTFPQFDQMRQQLKASVAQRHMLNGIMLAKMELPSTEYQKEIQAALKLSTDLPKSYQQEIVQVAQRLPLMNFREYVPNTKSPTSEQILKQADFHLAQKDYQAAFAGYNGLLIREPKHKEARVRLVDLYTVTKQSANRQEEVKNILKYYPEYRETLVQ